MRTKSTLAISIAFSALSGALMAQQKVSDRVGMLPGEIDPAVDLLPIVDISAGTAGSKKATINAIFEGWGMTAAGKALAGGADATAQRSTLGLGTAATLSHGTAAGNLVRLDATTAKLPAVDGSLLTNLPGGVLASQAEAEAGAENTKIMTALRVKQANDVRIGASLQAWDGGLDAFAALANPATSGYVLSSTTGGVLSWIAPGSGGGGGDLLAANNLSDLANAGTARTNLGLGTAATTAASAYEAALGNPATNGFILSSTTAGVRSWIAPPSGGGGGATYPLVADFTTGWVNQGTATATDVPYRGMMFHRPLISPAVDNVSLFLKPLSGASTWTYTARIVFETPGVSYGHSGLCLRESSSGKFIEYAFQVQSAAYPIRLLMNSPTSFGSDSSTIASPGNTFGPGTGQPPGGWRLKIVNDATNIIFSVSRDGFSWSQVATQSKTNWITPDQIGFALQSFGTPSSMLIIEFTGP